MRIAFANYGVSLGLQPVDRWRQRVDRLNASFETYRSGDEYDREGDHACYGLQLTFAASVDLIWSWGAFGRKDGVVASTVATPRKGRPHDQSVIINSAREHLT